MEGRRYDVLADGMVCRPNRKRLRDGRKSRGCGHCLWGIMGTAMPTHGYEPTREEANGGIRKSGGGMTTRTSRRGEVERMDDHSPVSTNYLTIEDVHQSGPIPKREALRDH